MILGICKENIWKGNITKKFLLTGKLIFLIWSINDQMFDIDKIYKGGNIRALTKFELMTVRSSCAEHATLLITQNMEYE